MVTKGEPRAGEGKNAQLPPDWNRGTSRDLCELE